MIRLGELPLWIREKYDVEEIWVTPNIPGARLFVSVRGEIHEFDYSAYDEAIKHAIKAAKAIDKESQ